jgi:phenylacetate-coenzyme A ligase PaaK-like adenylate-forming protein
MFFDPDANAWHPGNRKRISTRFSVNRSQWGTELNRRAYVVPAALDISGLLDQFQSHSPFYQNRLKNCTKWQEIPPLTRNEIESIPISTRDNRVTASTTSGTTGQKIRIAASAEEWLFRRFLLYRPYAFYPGLPHRIRQAIFVDAAPHAETNSPDGIQIGPRRYDRWMISARSPLNRIWSRLAWIGPHLVTGFPSAMVRVAEFFGRELRRLKVKAISPAGELLDPRWRECLQDAFQAPVYDRYGATECGGLAWQCPFCSRYHANSDEVIIEADQGRGCLVTPLYQTTQPLLRYELGDELEWQPTPRSMCPIKLPVIAVKAGRRDDWLFDQNDMKVAPLAFQLEQFDFIDQWSIVQEAGGEITLYASWRTPPTEPRIAAVLQEMAAVVRGRKVQIADYASYLPRGKFKRVHCEYAPGRRDAGKR